jgi:hypothetical protein
MNYDEIGFAKTWSKEADEIYINEILKREVKRESVWIDFLSAVGSVDAIDIKDEKFKQLVRQGIPNRFRALIWSKVTGADKRLMENSTLFSEFTKLKEAIPEKISRVIEADIPRTFSRSKKEIGSKIRRILHAFALLHPEVGYCQSLNFLAGIFCTVCGEELGFWNLVCVFEDYIPNDYYNNDLVGFQIDLRLMQMLVSERCPEIYQHAKDIGFEWMVIVCDWLLTIFSNCFPAPTVLRIWDSYLLEGPKILFRVAIAFLRINKDEILATGSMIELQKTIKRLQTDCIDQHKLMETAFGLKCFSKQRLVELRELAKDPNNCKLYPTGDIKHLFFGKL